MGTVSTRVYNGTVLKKKKKKSSSSAGKLTLEANLQVGLTSRETTDSPKTLPISKKQACKQASK